MARARCERAEAVIAHADFLSEGLWEYATIVFPAESDAEKEGTVTHPDGRVQRLRPAIARPDAVRAEWNVLADLSARLGHDPHVLSGPMASARLFEAVPFYEGLTLDELGGRGVRWPARPAAAGWPVGRHRAVRPRGPAARADARTARCASARSARSGRRPRSSCRPR